MSRHHLVIGTTIGLWAVAWGLGSVTLAIVAAVVALTILGFGVAFPRWKMFGPYICDGAAERKCVALTFDDGPDPHSTPALLDLLQTEKVAAAFFCVGQKVAAHPELTARIAQEGHLVENHSFAHSNRTNFYTTGRLRAELAEAQATIAIVTGQSPQLFRPPMGLTNPRVFRAARALNLKVIGWTARGLDTKLTEPVEIVARIMKRVRPGGILLLHDGNIPAERLVATVRKLLDNLRAEGYEVVRLDRLLT